MNGNDSRGGFLCTDDERLLVSRALELSLRGESDAVASSFLTPREQRIVFEAVKREGASHRLFMWGGYRGSERRKAIFLPSWLCDGAVSSVSLFSVEREDLYISLLADYGMLSLLGEHMCALKLSGSGYAELSHRDWLGSLMGLGLRRSAIGDIAIEGNTARVFCEKSAASYIQVELRKVGRDVVKVVPLEVDPSFEVTRSFEDIVTTVATPRLDGVVRALCNISRDEAAGLVLRGDAEVNYFCEKETDRHLSRGDILTVRGFGKFIIESAEDVTRRGRIRLIAKKYK